MRKSILFILTILSFEMYPQYPFQIIDDPTNTGLDASNHAETMAEEKAQKEIEKAEEQAQKSFQEKFAEYQKKLCRFMVICAKLQKLEKRLHIGLKTDRITKV